MTIATIVMTFAIVIFSEVTPKIYAINKPMKFSLAVAKLFFYYTKFISPVVFFINKIASYFMGLLGMKLDENPNKNMEEEFEGAIKYQKQHSKDNIEQIEYMSNLLELKNLKVATDNHAQRWEKVAWLVIGTVITTGAAASVTLLSI